MICMKARSDLDCSSLARGGGGGGGSTPSVEVKGMLVRNFLENSKEYPDFDFKHLKNTQIAGAIP